MDIKTFARAALRCFVRKARHGEIHYWAMKDDAPDWVTELVRNAHMVGNSLMLPNDWRYAFIVDALGCIVEGDIEGDGLETDIYNHTLLTWLSSNLDRAGYVNDFVAEYGVNSKDFDIMRVIAGGQLMEKREVFYSVKASLEGRLNA